MLHFTLAILCGNGNLSRMVATGIAIEFQSCILPLKILVITEKC